MNQVDCMHCGHHFETKTFMRQLVRCPECAKTTEVPETTRNLVEQKKMIDARRERAQARMGGAKAQTIQGSPNVVSELPELKKCPFCAENVKREAIKCKHCGSDLTGVGKSANGEQFNSGIGHETKGVLEGTVGTTPASTRGGTSGLYERIATKLDFSEYPWYLRWPLNFIKISIAGILGLIVILFVIFVILQFKTGELSIFGDKDSKADSAVAFIQCKEEVKSTLKSPSSANFASYGESTVKEIDKTTFSVGSYVDAQNSYGANIRTEWGCQATYLGGDPYKRGSWRIVPVVY